MTTSDDAEFLDYYKRVFGLTNSDLFEDGSVSERQTILAARADYELDRHQAFTIDPGRVALLIIDMQLGFVSRTSPQWVPQAERIIASLADFAERARVRDIPVLFTSAEFLDPSPTDALNMTVAMAEGNLAQNTDALQIEPTLWRDKDILITTKHTYDAFWQSDLDYRLKALGRDTLLIAGTLTNVCCEATARAGFDRGYHVALVSDLCATDNPLAQVASLQTVRRSYGRVLSSRELAATLASS